MTKLNRLIGEATESAKWRGHKLTKWMINDDKDQANCVCYQCGMPVYIETRPAPNSIEISGQAVAMNCRGN